MSELRVRFSRDWSVQVGDTVGVRAYTFSAGETATPPADVAALAIGEGAAAPVVASETADRPRGRR